MPTRATPPPGGGLMSKPGLVDPGTWHLIAGRSLLD